MLNGQQAFNILTILVLNIPILKLCVCESEPSVCVFLLHRKKKHLLFSAIWFSCLYAELFLIEGA